jgi:hypothetical protein
MIRDRGICRAPVQASRSWPRHSLSVCPQQQIAHCTADDVCSVSLLLQRLTRFQSTPAHVSALDAMSFERYDCRLPRLEQTAGKNLAEKR